MKISNSKKHLAKIIHENGGWREMAEFAAQDRYDMGVDFYARQPRRDAGDNFWHLPGRGYSEAKLRAGALVTNWHQTILSRDEYFHLYPAPDADAGSLSVTLDLVTDENKHEHVDSKPTIEQLAADYRNAKDYADRKQQEADAAKADAKAKLAEMVAAGKALGLVLSVAAPELALSVAPVQKYTGKFYNAELGEAPDYDKNTSDAVCDGCGKRYGEHYGDRCKYSSER